MASGELRRFASAQLCRAAVSRTSLLPVTSAGQYTLLAGLGLGAAIQAARPSGAQLLRGWWGSAVARQGSSGRAGGSRWRRGTRPTGQQPPPQQRQQQQPQQPSTTYVHFQGRGPFGTGGPGSSSARTWAMRAAVLAGGGVLFYYTYRQEIPYSHRNHLVLISPATARSLGEATYKQVLGGARAQHALLPSDHPRTAFVRKVGTQLAEVAGQGSGGGFFAHMKECEWEFSVIKSPQINAFVVPGGKVVVFSGLLDALAREDELAFVLAHEIAHVVARHADEKISTSGLASVFNMFFYSLFGFSLEGALVLGLELPYSRRNESEADLIGLHLMAEACYDPRFAPGVHKKIEGAAPASRVPALLSTHPPSAKRIRSLVDNVPEAMQVYESQDCQARRAGLYNALQREVHRQVTFENNGGGFF
eukprot:jgi/Tetstr1/437262/TSEL_025992.t1